MTNCQDVEDSATYTFLPASGTPAEAERLDGLHEGITDYFGQRLSLAPLEDCNPEDILELGSGTGAWAIRAAEQFPNAKVLAVDLSPLPDRPLPGNIHFARVDITQPLPFTKATFDIVHARFIIMHLPNGRDILRNVIELVKPGGWLLVEEPDDESMQDGGGPPSPGMASFAGAWINMLRSRGAEPCIGRHLEGILRSSGHFSEVNVRRVIIPVSGKSQDQNENRLGATWKANINRNLRDFPSRFADKGITKEIAESTLRELNDPSRSLTTHMYFTWSRRLLQM